MVRVRKKAMMFLAAGTAVLASGLFCWSLLDQTPVSSDSFDSAPKYHSPDTTGSGQKSMDSVLLSVPYLSQEGILPSGCEAVSATMVVQYYGLDLEVYHLIDQYLPRSDFWYEDGQLTNVSPSQAFIGDPYATTGLGCYAPVIQKALNSYFEAENPSLSAVLTTGTSLEELCSEYISKDIPVLIWASIRMQPLKSGMQWRLSGGQESFTWQSPEHCLVLVGFDDDFYYFNDPYQSQGQVSYDKQLVDSRFRQLGMQSVVVQYK